jgi:hypothetical protein
MEAETSKRLGNGIRKPRANTERYEQWMAYRLNLRSREVWKHPVEYFEAPEHESVFDLLAEALTPFFLFLAAGRGPSSPVNNLEQRAWVLLYACRPDLLAGDDSGSAAARRWDVDPAAVTSLVREFESYIPGFRSLGGGTKRRDDSVRRAVSLARHKEHLEKVA